MGFPGGSEGKASACNAGDLGSIPGLGKIPWRRERLPPVFWPGEFHGLYSPWGCKESDMTEQLSLSFFHLRLIFLMNHFANNIMAKGRQALIFLNFFPSIFSDYIAKKFL